MRTRELLSSRVNPWLHRRWPLLAVVVAAFLLHLPLLLSKLGGFHAYNEGFYALGARAQAAGSLLDTLVRPRDLNNMPLFSWLLTLVVKVGGSAEWVIRLPSLAASLVAVYLAGLLSERLVHPRAAVPAAVLVAMSPLLLLVGTNAQPDMLMVTLAMGGLAAYAEAYRAGREGSKRKADGGAELRWRAVSGLLFGLSILAKLNGALLPMSVILWETTRRRSLAWLPRPSARVWLAVIAAIPGAWVVLQLVVRPAAFLGSQGYLAATVDLLDRDLLSSVPNEAFFQLGPATALAAAAGIVWALVRPTAGRALLLCIASVGMAFFLFYHFHAYYLVIFVLAATLLAALPIAAAEPPALSWALLALVVALTLPFDLLTYQQKNPASGIATVSRWIIEREPGPKVLVLPKPASDNSGKVFGYYMPEAEQRMRWPGWLDTADGAADLDRPTKSAATTPTFVVFYTTNRSYLPQGTWAQGPTDHRFPVILGRALVHVQDSIHWFAKRRLGWPAVGPVWWFGSYRVVVPDLYVVDVSRLSPKLRERFRQDWYASEEVGPGP